MGTTAPNGIRTFAIACAGQLISVLGSGLTAFAMSVWIYKQTNSITLFGLALFSAMLPSIVFMPFAGVIVDRHDRKRLMVLSDSASGLITLALAGLLFAERLQVWHICLAGSVASMLAGIRFLAFSSTVTLLIPKARFARAIGISQFADSAALIIAPILAGFLVTKISVYSIVTIDAASFIFCAAILLTVKIPNPDSVARARDQKTSMFSEFNIGWAFVMARRGLLGLLVFAALVNFSTTIMQVLITPLILRIASPAALGPVLSAGAAGAVVGSLFISIWGGPKSRVRGVLGFSLLQAFALMIGGLHLTPIVVGTMMFLVFFGFPICNNCSQVIWQSKVPPEMQGRVFAARRMVVSLSLPIAYLTAGPLADHVFEPLMSENGALASSLGQIIGVGPSHGIALLFILLGSLMTIEVTAAFMHPRIRRVEAELPDAIGVKPEADQKPLLEEEIQDAPPPMSDLSHLVPEPE